jgi:hypothetical protein
MKKLSWLIAVLAITVLFFQCQKELHYTGGPDTGIPVTPDPITASLQGNIVDENEQPAAGVVVTAGASTTVTDDKGYFRFTNATLDKNTTLVTATKDGYFKGYRVFGATSGCNQVAIKLIKKDLAGTIAAATGGEVSTTSGAKVALPAGGVVTASSNGDYSGDVKVYASYINPKSADISKVIPGSLMANDKDGKRVALASYGMLAVELSSGSGEKLQIKSGSTATLTIPIPSASVASAPATIPLWYVDETTGIWQEEGTAIKQGSNYIGEVKHFSFWNCDYPYDAVNLSLTLHTPDGSPLVNEMVSITAKISSDTSSYSSTAYGWTDSLGQVKGLVPANTNLALQVISQCYNVVYSQDVAPLTASKDLGVIKITDATSSVLTLKGSLVDCNNNPVLNGYAFIILDGYSRYVKVDSASGQFSTTYIVCSGLPITAVIIGVDKNTQQQSEAKTLSTVFPTTDAGSITACGTSSEQYINYTLDGISYSISGSSIDSSMYGSTNDSGYTSISGYGGSGNISTTVQGSIVGTFPMLNLSVNNYQNADLEQPSTITFTSYPASVGNFYEGSLNGSFISYRNTDSAITHTITGTFKVRRSN